MYVCVAVVFAIVVVLCHCRWLRWAKSHITDWQWQLTATLIQSQTHTQTCTCIHTYKYTCVDKRVFTFTLGNHRKRGIWNVIYTYNERKNWRDNKLYTLLFPLLLLLLLRFHSCLLCVLGEFAFAVRWFSLAWNTQHTNGALAQRGVYFIFAHKIIFNLLAIPATARILLNTATHSRRSVI